MRNRFVQSCATISTVVFFTYLLLSINFSPHLDEVLASDPKSETPKPLPYFRASVVKETDNYLDSNELESSHKVQITRPKIWVSMSLCFDETTDKYGKSHYPYLEVTPLALMIWKYFFPDPDKVGILLFLVHKKRDKSPHMEAYEKIIAQTGAIIEWVTTDGIDCVLMAQIVRMFAFGHPLVKPDDVVMTVDVNLFLMTGKILDPIYENPDKLAWIYQFDETADIETGIGESFNQNLMSMQAKIWRSILEAPSKLTYEWLQDRIEKVSLDKNETWYYDQWISTFAILKHRICSAPKKSGLWNHKDLVFDPDFDDSATCWRGKFYKDCNKEVKIVGDSCKWWHFYPSESFETHVNKFNEITHNFFKLNISSIIDT